MAIMEALLRPELPPTGAKRSILRHMCLFLLVASLTYLFLPCFRSSLGLTQAPRSINADSLNSSQWYTIPVGSLISTTQHKYGEMLVYRGKIYVTPHDATEFLILDSTTNVVSVIPTDSIVDQGRSCHWLGIVQYEGKMYCAPCNANQLLVYDTNSMSLSGVPTAYVGIAKWCGIAAWKGKIYAAPYNAEVMLVYDIAKNKISGVATSAVCTGAGKWIGLVAHAGKLYSAPFSDGDPRPCEQMLVYDTESGKVSGISTASVITGSMKWHGMTLFDNKIYATPCGAPVLIYDPESGEVSGVGYDVGKGKEWSGFAACGGKLYSAPFSMDEILMLDPQTRAVSSIPVKAPYAFESAAFVEHHGHLPSSDQGYFFAWNGVACEGGKLYFSPFNADNFLVYNVPLHV